MSRTCLPAGLLLIALAPAVADAHVATAAITGTVRGPDRLALPGVAITVAHRASGHVFAFSTNAQGTYYARNLENGPYTVRAELHGFRTQVREVVISEPAEYRIDFALELAPHREGIQVVGSVTVDRLEVTDRGETGARDVGEALARLTGVSLIRRAGIATDVLIGAYQGENLTVLIDGARLHGACPNNMDPPTAHVDLSEVARVEIGKGPFDVTNQGSLGGFLNIVTARPEQGFHGQAELSYGSWGFINPAATVSHGRGRVSALFGYSFRAAGPYRDGSGTRFTEYANYRPDIHEARAFEAGTAWGRVYLRPRREDVLQVSYTRQHLDRVLYPYLLMDGIWDIADRASASYETTRAGGLDALSLAGYMSQVRHYMTDEYRLSASGARGHSMGTHAGTLTAGGKVRVARRGLVAGGELYRRQWEAMTRFARAGYAPQFALPDVVQVTGGIYAQVARQIGMVDVEAGGRVDRTSARADAAKANVALYQAYHQTRSTSATDTYASGKIRVTGHAGAVRLTASAGLTARPPDPQEQYYALARQGSDWVGNPELAPVRNAGFRMDAAYRRARLFMDGALQYDFVNGFITPYAQERRAVVPGVMNAMARSFANVDARIRTAEVKVTYSLARGWLFGVTGFHTRGTKETDPSRGINSGELSEIPPLRAEVSARHDRGRAFGEALWTLTGRQDRVDADLGERPTPSSGILTLRAGVRLSHVRASVSLQNALDHWYYSHLSFQRDPFRSGVAVREPGRALHANVVVAW